MNEQELILRSGYHLSGDEIIGLRGTKVLQLDEFDVVNNDFAAISDYGKAAKSDNVSSYCTYDYVNTWSAVIRTVISELKSDIDFCIKLCGITEFNKAYEGILHDILDNCNVAPNTNFVRRFYLESEEKDLITSTVYNKNKNHKLEIFKDEKNRSFYVCAVYTGEIIWVIEALMDTIDFIYNKYCQYNTYKSTVQKMFKVHFIKRDLIEDESSEILAESTNTEKVNNDLANDLITLFIESSIVQTRVSDEIKADLDVMKSKLISIASKNNIDIISLMRNMIS